MPALQVRDLPEPIYSALVKEAREQHRSIAQQTIHILEQHFLVEATVEDLGGIHHNTHEEPGWLRGDGTPEERAARAQRKRKVLERIASDPRPPVELSAEDIVRIVREGREERDAHIGKLLGITEEAS